MKTNKKSIIATVAGNSLEYYDVTLYGFFAPFIGPLFFPAVDPFVSTLIVLSTFAAGFLMRPLGGLFFGYIGDRWGRKKALIISILLITIPTISIGILPTYEKIGLLAPITLVLCRLLQGFCTGGEYSGAAVFITENTDRKEEGFSASLLSMSGILGALFGTMVGAFFTLAWMPEWGWRIPFILGGVLGGGAYYMRYFLKESQVFEKLAATQSVSKNPFAQIWTEDKRNFICTIGIAGAAIVPYYLTSVYTNTLLAKQLKLSLPYLLVLNSLLMIWLAFFIPVMGKISDKIGAKRLMKISCLSIFITAYPLFYFSINFLSVERVFIMQLFINLCSAAFVAPLSVFVSRLFSASHRYSGVGIAYNSGTALFGGTTPLIATSLVYYTNIPHASVFYLMTMMVMGYWAVEKSRRIDD